MSPFAKIYLSKKNDSRVGSWVRGCSVRIPSASDWVTCVYKASHCTIVEIDRMQTLVPITKTLRSRIGRGRRWSSRHVTCRSRASCRSATGPHNALAPSPIQILQTLRAHYDPNVLRICPSRDDIIHAQAVQFVNVLSFRAPQLTWRAALGCGAVIPTMSHDQRTGLTAVVDLDGLSVGLGWKDD